MLLVGEWVGGSPAFPTLSNVKMRARRRRRAARRAPLHVCIRLVRIIALEKMSALAEYKVDFAREREEEDFFNSEEPPSCMQCLFFLLPHIHSLCASLRGAVEVTGGAGACCTWCHAKESPRCYARLIFLYEKRRRHHRTLLPLLRSVCAMKP